MAEKKKDKVTASETKKGTPSLKETNFLIKVRKRFSAGVKAVQHIFDASEEDLKFLNNEGHWNERILNERVAAGRPCLVFNDAVPYMRNVVGEQRESRPQTKVSPTDNKATQQVAEIMAGYLRNRKYECKADNAYDISFGQQLGGGFGVYRIITEFEAPDSFDQTFVLKPQTNQFAVIFDPNAQEWHKNDGDWMGVYSHIDKEIFESKYGDIDKVSFDIGNSDWYPKKDKITVLEYFEKEHFRKPLFQLSDGSIVTGDDIPEGVEKRIGAEWEVSETKNELGELVKLDQPVKIKILKKRIVDDYKIYRYILCGHKILEEKSEWPCRYWGTIPVDGDVTVIKGKTHKRSLIRFAKDPIRAYEFSRNTELETLGLVPNTQVMGSEEMFAGYENQWDDVKGSYSRKLVNPDPMFPGLMPQRLSALDPAYVGALTQSSMQAREEVRQSIGPNVILPKGQQGLPNVSGTALGKWQKEGDVGTFIFVDNLQRAIEWGDVVCVELMQRILDTNRKITIRKADNSTEEVEINKKVLETNPQNPQDVRAVTVNDFTVGRYGVETSLGPSYSAQRADQAQIMLSFVQAIPQVGVGTAHILAGMLFDINAQGQGGPVQEFVKAIKKQLIRARQLDESDLKPEEAKEFAPLLMKMSQQPKLPPHIMAKVEETLSKAQLNIAKVKQIQMETGMGEVEYSEKVLTILGNLQLGLAQLGMPGQPGQGQQQGQDQAALPGPGGQP